MPVIRRKCKLAPFVWVYTFTLYLRIRILSISFKMESLYLKVQIKYYRSNGVQTATSFKFLNDVAVCTLLDP